MDQVFDRRGNLANILVFKHWGFFWVKQPTFLTYRNGVTLKKPNKTSFKRQKGSKPLLIRSLGRALSKQTKKSKFQEKGKKAPAKNFSTIKKRNDSAKTRTNGGVEQLATAIKRNATRAFGLRFAENSNRQLFLVRRMAIVPLTEKETAENVFFGFFCKTKNQVQF